jgi:hypothetical protein
VKQALISGMTTAISIKIEIPLTSHEKEMNKP